MLGLGIGIGLGGGGGSSFSPAALPGLVWWTQADSLSASPVSSLSYGSGNLTQGTVPDQPTWTAASANANGKPSILYSGSEFLSTPDIPALELTGDITICSVLYVAVAGGFNTIVSKGSPSEFDFYVRGDTGTASFVRQSSAVACTAGAFPALVLGIITVTCAANAVAFYVNGIAQGTATSVTPATSANAVQIGQRSGAGTALNGEQPAVVICSQALSAGNLQLLHRYFGEKYGIVVP